MSTPTMRVKFKCPNDKCENHAGHENEILEEVMVGVIQESTIEAIESGGEYVTVDYHPDIRTDGGEVIQYRCGHCGYILSYEEGSVMEGDDDEVSTPEELYEWLKDRKMLEAVE